MDVDLNGLLDGCVGSTVGVRRNAHLALGEQQFDTLASLRVCYCLVAALFVVANIVEGGGGWGRVSRRADLDLGHIEGDHEGGSSLWKRRNNCSIACSCFWGDVLEQSILIEATWLCMTVALEGWRRRGGEGDDDLTICTWHPAPLLEINLSILPSSSHIGTHSAEKPQFIAWWPRKALTTRGGVRVEPPIHSSLDHSSPTAWFWLAFHIPRWLHGDYCFASQGVLHHNDRRCSPSQLLNCPSLLNMIWTKVPSKAHTTGYTSLYDGLDRFCVTEWR